MANEHHLPLLSVCGQFARSFFAWVCSAACCVRPGSAKPAGWRLWWSDESTVCFSSLAKAAGVPLSPDLLSQNSHRFA